jgi:hypothetical protein
MNNASVYAMKENGEVGILTPLILNLGPRWMRVVRFTSGYFILVKYKSPTIPVNRRLCGLQNRPASFGVEECYFIIIYLLNPRNRVILEKLTSSQLVKIFPAFYGTRRFINAFTSARHLSLS